MTKKSRKTMTKKTVAKPYELTPYERTRARTYIADMKENPPAPMVKVSTNGGVVRVESGAGGR